MIKLPFILFILINFNIYCQSNTDTVSIYDSLYTGLPQRFCNSNGSNNFYLDSLRVGNSFINEGYQNYYLKIYSIDSTLLIEGDFFDRFPTGVIKKYNDFGLITDSLIYEFKKLDKPIIDKCKWKSATPNGGKFTFKYPIYYESKLSNTYVKYEYGNGSLIRKIELINGIKIITNYGYKGKVTSINKYDIKGRLINE